MYTVLSVTLPFFAIIGCGWLARRLSLVPEASVAGMTSFVFTFALPALLFRSTATRPIAEIADWPFMGLYVLGMLVTVGLGMAVGRLFFKADLQGLGIHALAAAMGNLGFMGLPLISGLLGEASLTPMVLMLTLDVTVLVPLILAFLELGRSDQAGASLVRRIWRAARSSILNPIVIAIFLGIGASLLSLALPLGIDNFLSLLGAAAGPTALFALGASLYGRPLADGLGEAGTMAAMKLLAYPLVMATVMMSLYDGDPLWTRSAILVAALPCAGNLYVFASRYGARVARASTAVLLSTSFAVVSFTLLVWVW
ncbi:MAG: AEC family transporter [Rhodospirillum sp.]|nr:AEC family transporter [Rhodospirillum sp.]MCF8490035.1 AEC family transporter [Rhodospirillum sp.]MCF8499560.1 AEC family transporter [Rhodospirillum sp.]